MILVAFELHMGQICFPMSVQFGGTFVSVQSTGHTWRRKKNDVRCKVTLCLVVRKEQQVMIVENS